MHPQQERGIGGLGQSPHMCTRAVSSHMYWGSLLTCVPGQSPHICTGAVSSHVYQGSLLTYVLGQSPHMCTRAVSSHVYPKKNGTHARRLPPPKQFFLFFFFGGGQSPHMCTNFIFIYFLTPFTPCTEVRRLPGTHVKRLPRGLAMVSEAMAKFWHETITNKNNHKYSDISTHCAATALLTESAHGAVSSHVYQGSFLTCVLGKSPHICTRPVSSHVYKKK